MNLTCFIETEKTATNNKLGIISSVCIVCIMMQMKED